MAFDDLTKSQRREVIRLVKELGTGRYDPEFEVDHIPSNQLEHSRINIEIKQLDGKRGFLIEFYDPNDFYSIAASRYIESTTSEFDKARLTTKAYEQYKLLTEVPTRETLPSDTIKFWLEEFAHVEEGLANQTSDIAERRFTKWKERASRSFDENLISEVSRDLGEIKIQPYSRRVTKPFDREVQIARAIHACRRFLEEVLVEIKREGEEAYKPKPADTPMSRVQSNVVSTISEDVPTEMDSTAASVAADYSTDGKSLHAIELYERVKTLIQTTDPLDQQTARLIVETSDDAINEFGNTNQEKKLDLRNWKSEAEAVLPPLTIKELKERAEAQILAKGYPARNLPRRILLYVIGAGIMVAALVGIYKEFLEPSPKPLENVRSASNDGKPPDSISVNLPEGLTLRSAIKFIAQIDNFTADFKANCNNKLLETEVEGGPLTAASTIELIELLRLRLKNSRQTVAYQVEKKPEKGTYEISCR
jgi:hypothetical protein